MDAHPKVVNLAEALPEQAWKPLERLPRYEIATAARRKPQRVKESIVRFKGYENKVLIGEDIAEIDYQPLKCFAALSAHRACARTSACKRASRFSSMKSVTSSISPTASITQASKSSDLANGRCNQENVIEQLKNGVNAMRMPVDDLLSNWAYMVMTSLAWNLKSVVRLALA